MNGYKTYMTAGLAAGLLTLQWFGLIHLPNEIYGGLVFVAVIFLRTAVGNEVADATQSILESHQAMTASLAAKAQSLKDTPDAGFMGTLNPPEQVRVFRPAGGGDVPASGPRPSAFVDRSVLGVLSLLCLLAGAILLGLVSVGCSSLSNETKTFAASTNGPVLAGTTKTHVYTIFDGQANVTKLRATSERAEKGVYAPGLAVSGIDDSSSAPTAFAQALIQGGLQTLLASQGVPTRGAATSAVVAATPQPVAPAVAAVQMAPPAVQYVTQLVTVPIAGAVTPQPAAPAVAAVQMAQPAVQYVTQFVTVPIAGAVAPGNGTGAPAAAVPTSGTNATNGTDGRGVAAPANGAAAPAAAVPTGGASAPATAAPSGGTSAPATGTNAAPVIPAANQ
jgi:hypothetical protein